MRPWYGMPYFCICRALPVKFPGGSIQPGFRYPPTAPPVPHLRIVLEEYRDSRNRTPMYRDPDTGKRAGPCSKLGITPSARLHFAECNV